MKPALISFLLLATAWNTSAMDGPRPQLQLVEQASQEGFPLARPFMDHGANRLQAAGVFLRIREGEKLYAICLYVDLPRLLELTKGQDRTSENLARLLLDNKVAHAFVSRFVQPLPRANRVAFLEKNLKAYWPTEGFNPEDKALKRFIAFFDRSVNKGAETQVWMDTHGKVYLREVGGKVVKGHFPELGQAFTASYLGDPSMDESMKRDLLKDLPLVMEMVEMMKTPVLMPDQPHEKN